MTTVEEQNELVQDLQRIVINYGKDSPSRKNKEYYMQRKERLEVVWEAFKEKHAELSKDVDLKGHKYFVDDVYTKVKNMYNKYHEIFVEEITKLTAEENAMPDQTFKQITNRGPTAVNSNTILNRQKIYFDALNRMLNKVVTEDASPAYAAVKSDAIKRMWARIEDLHISLCENVDESGKYGYDKEVFFELEDRVQETKIGLTCCNHETVGYGNELKLPAITIPKFDGDYEKWTQFRDLFKQLVHKQPISECQKLWYLKANISGDAERLIRGLLTSSENYAAAWETLEERYNNKRLLVSMILNKLLAQPSQTTEFSSYTAIRSLYDTTKECLLALNNLDVPIAGWDPILVHLLLKKMDKSSHVLFEQSLQKPKELPTVEQLLAFLETRFQMLESLGSKGKPEFQGRSPYRALVSTVQNCVKCKDIHPLYSCKAFLQMSVTDRLKIVKKNNLCMNCLKPGHLAVTCSSRECNKCGRRHNSLLHITEYHTAMKRGNTVLTESIATNSNCTKEQDSGVSLTTLDKESEHQHSYVLLGTAIIELSTDHGSKIKCRAVLDSGSQVNIITDRVIQKLRVPLKSNAMRIYGIGNGTQATNKRASLYLKMGSDKMQRMEAHVLKTIISPQPTQRIDITTWNIPDDIVLADPHFYQSKRVDVLLGAEFYYQLLKIGQIHLNNDLPILQNTLFGWMVAGKIGNISSPTKTKVTCAVSTEGEQLENILSKFWQLEEVESTKKPVTTVERWCETHFIQTTKRRVDGRFVVKLPFKDSPRVLGESRDIALRRFLALERRFQRNPELLQEYTAFMKKYLELGHMKEIATKKIPHNHYFLPHHCVINAESTSTRLRVVFDASAKTSTQIALNEILHSGPMVQDKMWIILLRFRLPKFVFSADIEKMYRQIIIDDDHQPYQLILWRDQPNEPIKIFKLLTVTYGTRSAPYLAVRCLKQLALEKASSYPLGANILNKNFYVDNAFAGSNSITETLEQKKQITKLLDDAGFNLRKWSSNNCTILEGIPLEDREKELTLSDDDKETIKILGLTWLPKLDKFCVRVKDYPREKLTRRTIASDLGRLFDPLGLLGPIIVKAKIIVQDLIKEKADWDAAVPSDILDRWVHFREDLQVIDNIHIPRHIFGEKIPVEVQLHVFADASKTAYGAALYVRSRDAAGTLIVRLLCAKSRIAPIKTQTIPRLELCAAKLAVDLVYQVKEELGFTNEKIFYWTDSQIVLDWINSEFSPEPIFIANRVSAILDKTVPAQWRHIRSAENPADVLSRGTSPQRLIADHLWFYGPIFLHGREEMWPPTYVLNVSTKPTVTQEKQTVHHLPSEENIIDLIAHRNSFRRLQRIVAYILKFKNQGEGDPSQSTKQQKYALGVIIRNMQMNSLIKNDIYQLKRANEVSKNSPLAGMTPFLDENNIVRIGGRLEASNLSYDSKHPMVIPYDHDLTRLMMTGIHVENLHLGPSALLAKTRQEFWPLKGKAIARGIVQRCVVCIRSKPRLLQQVMGNLPITRIEPARPFINAGVDFCGPVWIHYAVRGKHPQKAYIAVFVCFATKAVHLELVSNLTTEAFIGALKRFIGRRGRCKNLYCDNATNFVGAKNQIEELQESIYTDTARKIIGTQCANKGIQFHFIPPRAPHFGGLWEAAVKSAKSILKKIVASAALTYEQLETVFIDIEAILNSRPLVPMSSNPNDFTALTPGHFLIGEPLNSTIEPTSKGNTAKLSDRWKEVSALREGFWNRWRTEYLQHLQHKAQWKRGTQNVKIGMLVLLKKDDVPVFKWPLGRIKGIYTGNDGRIRVVDVQTAGGVVKRAIHYLAPLPIEDNGLLSTKTNESSKETSLLLVSTQMKGRRTQEQDEPPKKRVKLKLDFSTNHR